MPLRYARFSKSRGDKGSIVFINGQDENLFKYLELFYDLFLEGYSPIYTYDHRGQGLSSHFRLDPKVGYADHKGRELSRHFLPHPRAGYVERFSHYSSDLRTFLNDIVLNDSEVDSGQAVCHRPLHGGNCCGGLSAKAGGAYQKKDSPKRGAYAGRLSGANSSRSV